MTAYFVTTDGDDTNSGQSWEDAFRTLQHAMLTGEVDDTISIRCDDGTILKLLGNIGTILPGGSPIPTWEYAPEVIK